MLVFGCWLMNQAEAKICNPAKIAKQIHKMSSIFTQPE